MSHLNIRKYFKLVIIFLLYSCASTLYARTVTGNIDNIYNEKGKTYIRGWACHKGLKKSVHVRFYVTAPRSRKKEWLFSTLANHRAERAVSRRCGTNHKYYRFKKEINNSKLNKFQGYTVFAYGISLVRGIGHKELGKSGRLKIPKDNRQVIGNLDNIIKIKGKTYVRGWACHKGLKKSVRVRFYVTAPKSRKKEWLFSTLANHSAERAVSNRCGTGYRLYRFKKEINKSKLNKFQGYTVFAYGISIIRGVGHKTLGKSGRLKLPTIASKVNVENVEFYTDSFR